MNRWLLVLIPAVITSFAAVTPVIFEYYKKWSGDLNYEVVTGPSLRVGTESRRVLAISIRNSGSSKVTSVLLVLKPNGGNIENFAVEDRSRTIERSEIRDGELVIAAKTMHPDERISASVMFVAAQEATQPEIILRSDETRGYQAKEPTRSQERLPLLVSSLLAGASVFAMGLLLRGSWFRSEIRRLLSLEDSALAARREYLLFITRAFQLPLDAVVFNARPEVTYREYGSLLMASAIADPASREKLIQALKALLLCPMAESSRETIRRAIRDMAPQSNLDDLFKAAEARAEELSDFADFRAGIMALTGLTDIRSDIGAPAKVSTAS